MCVSVCVCGSVVHAMEAGNEEARRRASLYLTEREMLHLLTTVPRFTLPMTRHAQHYVLYRGRRAATVLTLRFNVTAAQFNVDFMIRHCLAQCEGLVPEGQRLSCCTDYDFVLVNLSGPVPSYYIWCANSNRATFNESQETSLIFTPDALIQYCRQAFYVHVPDLEINFHTSNCSIHRLLAVTLSFIY